MEILILPEEITAIVVKLQSQKMTLKNPVKLVMQRLKTVVGSLGEKNSEKIMKKNSEKLFSAPTTGVV